jgi:hypothetical protein
VMSRISTFVYMIVGYGVVLSIDGAICVVRFATIDNLAEIGCVRKHYIISLWKVREGQPIVIGLRCEVRRPKCSDE